MPFYRGDKSNVIPVYDGSFNFHGFVAQGYSRFKSDEFTHYLFVADDLLLNPALNEDNFHAVTGLPIDHCFLASIRRTGPNDRKYWAHSIRGFEWKIRAHGTQGNRELPTYNEARVLIERHGVKSHSLNFEQIWRVPTNWVGWIKCILLRPRFASRYIMSRLLGQRYALPYPMIRGYSDLFVVTADNIEVFRHYCGVLAATDLFAEYAIPTAMALSSAAIVTGDALSLKWRAYWNSLELNELSTSRGSLRTLLNSFPSEQLFIHPIKLSQWWADFEPFSQVEFNISDISADTIPHREIEGVRIEGTDVCLQSIGHDPQLLLPQITLDPSRVSHLRLEVTVPSSTLVQVYFQRLGDSSFSEAKTCQWNVQTGRHCLYSTLGRSLNGKFRIDPGTRLGEYRIHEFSLFQSSVEADDTRHLWN